MAPPTNPNPVVRSRSRRFICLSSPFGVCEDGHSERPAGIRPVLHVNCNTTSIFYAHFCFVLHEGSNCHCQRRKPENSALERACQPSHLKAREKICKQFSLRTRESRKYSCTNERRNNN